MLPPLLLLALLLLAGPSMAAPVVWEFEGSVQAITGPATLVEHLSSLGVRGGAGLVGSMRFETSTPDSRPDDASSGRYWYAIDRQTLDVGEIHLDLSIDPTLASADIYVLGPPGPYGLFSDVYQLDPTAAFLQRVSVSLNLDTADPSVFPDDSLPAVPPPLSSLAPYGPSDGQGTYISFVGETPEGAFVVLAVVTRLGAVAEPGAATLLGVAAFALAALRRRRSS